MNTKSGNGIIVYINGELSFVTVPTLNKNHRNLILQNSNVIFDLSQVTFSDNAGVAFLVALASFAKEVHKEISFVNIPKQLLDLIEALKVREILPILVES